MWNWNFYFVTIFYLKMFFSVTTVVTTLVMLQYYYYFFLADVESVKEVKKKTPAKRRPDLTIGELMGGHKE